MFKVFFRFVFDGETDLLFKLENSETVQNGCIVNKNKEAIINAVKICTENEDNLFWCDIADLAKNCDWLSGRTCHCNEHDGSNLLDTICIFVKIFVAIENDDRIKIKLKIVKRRYQLLLIKSLQITMRKYHRNCKT